MSRFTKQLIFIAIGVAIVAAGGIGIWAVNNRGAAASLWLKMDEGQGATTYDASGNANNGTITGATWQNEENCKTGKCLFFDGSGDSVSIASAASLNPTAGVTVEGWVRPNTFPTSTNATIASKPSQYALDINQGMARFRAYANSTWYTAQAGEGLGAGETAALFREPFDGTLKSTATFTPAFGYRALTPANLTSKLGVLITQSDNLQYSRGSQATADGTNVAYENFDPNQGTLEFWVRPNWAGSDGGQYNLLRYYISGTNQIYIRKQTNNYWYFDVIGGGTDKGVYVSSNNSAGDWVHIVAVWDINNTVDGANYLAIYKNGVKAVTGDATRPLALVGSGTLYIGQASDNTQTFNGIIAGRILNRPLSSTEVTALYAAGAGSTDTFTVTPDTVWSGTYSDSATTNAYQHQGKSVSVVSDGATEDTITTATGADTSFKDNDRIVVSDGTGYKVEGFVDGTPSATSMAIDNGAGADTGTTEKVGRNLDLNALYYAQAANNTVHDITTQDISISAWVKVDADAGASNAVLFKSTGNSTGVGYKFYVDSAGQIIGQINDGTDNYSLTSSTGLKDNKWHYVTAIFDRDNATNCNLYLDGSVLSTSKIGTITAIDSITNTNILTLGARSGADQKLDGQLRDVKLYYAAGDHWSDAQVLYQAQHPFDYSSNAGTLTDYWQCTDNAANTTVTGSVNNLTASANTSVFTNQEAFVSKNLIADSGGENGGLGGITAGDSASTLAKNTTASSVKFDAQSLKITNADATQAFARQTITTVAGEDYRFHGWFKSPATPNGASRLVDVDGTAALGVTVTQAGATAAATWYEVDFTFEAADTATDIDLGSGSVTNGEIGYWDNVEILPNLVNNGGMEGTYVSGVAPGWTISRDEVLSASTDDIHSGGEAQKIQGVGSYGGVTQTRSVVANKYYTLSFWAKMQGGSSGQVRIRTGSPDYSVLTKTISGSWQKYYITTKSQSVTVYIDLFASYSEIMVVDDILLVELDTAAASTATVSTGANSFNTGKWGESNGAFLVDGGDQLYYPATNNISATAGTISFWVKQNGWSGADGVNHYFFDWGSGVQNRFRIHKQTDNTIYFIMYGNTASGYKQISYPVNSSTFATSTWYHIVGTWTASGPTALYVNGSSVGSSGSGGSWTDFVNPGGSFQLGGSGSSATLYNSDAYFEDTRIYNTVLSPTDISSLYTNSYHNSLVKNDWAYLSGVYSKSSHNLKIYVNGVLKSTTDTGSSYDLGTGSSVLTIGDGLTGYLDDIKVFPEARSASQIKADYTGKATPRGATARSVTVGEQTNTSEGLVGYWKMDEASWAGTASEVVDSSGNANHGTAAGGATKANTTSTAKFGMAGDFDGTDDYVLTNDSVSLNTFSQITLSAWVKPSSLRAQMIMSKHNGGTTGSYFIQQLSSSQIRFTIINTSSARVDYDVNYTLSTTQFTHIECVYNGSSMLVYINGNVMPSPASQTGSVKIVGAAGLYMGNYAGLDLPFSGQIDDVKIYNKARSAEQVRRDYDSGPPPVARWKMDENTGQYAYDTSGNNNTGTLGSSFTPSSDDPTWVSGKYGSALKFDGSNDYVDAGTGITIGANNDFTYSLWVNSRGASPVGTWNVVVGGSSQYNYSLYADDGTGRPWLYLSYEGSVFRGLLGNIWSLNVWHHLSLTRTGDTFSIYQDGVFIRSYTYDTATSLSHLYIGGEGAQVRHGYGLIDDVRIYNYARTQKQIMEDMLGSPKLISEGGTGSYVGYWPMDEGSGDTAYDKSVNRNNGDLAGACPGASTCPTWTSNGKFGKALSFDGGDYVQAIDSASLDPTVITISAWVNPNLPASGAYHPIVSKANTGTNQGYWLNYDSRPTPKIRFIVGNASTNKDYNLTYTLPNNIWSHLVATYDGSYLRIYVNGILVGTSSIFTDGMVVPTNKTLRIGSDDTPNGYFIGSIDEVKIYPFALSPAEIKEEYNHSAAVILSRSGSGGEGSPTSSSSALGEYCIPGDSSPCVAPVARWKMDEKTGQYANDISGNANTGTLGTGATADDSDPVWKSAASCHSGSCLKFDGSNDYVGLGTPASLMALTYPLTIEAWVKPTSLANSGVIVSLDVTDSNSDIAFGFSTAANRLYLGRSTYQYGLDNIDTLMTAGKWQHWTVVFTDTTHIYFYLDGVSRTLTNVSNYFSASLNNIGARNNGTALPFNGSIDDIHIYNYARTPAQIAYDYNRGAPVAWWKMNDGQNSSTTCDATTSVVRDSAPSAGSGQAANNGALYLGGSPATSTAWSEGKYGCGLTFDGSNDYVSVADNGFGKFNNQTFTISAWIKPTTIAQKVIWSYDFTSHTEPYYAMHLRMEASGNVSFIWNNSGASITALTTTQAPLTINNWYHIVATFKSGEQKIYVNAINLKSSARADTITFYNQPVRIGGTPNYSSYFPGTIDDVQIYNYALTATQVKTLYNQNSAVRFGPTEGLP